MSAAQLFTLLLVTVAMGITGIKQVRHDPFAAAFMLAIPVIGWAAILFGR